MRAWLLVLIGCAAPRVATNAPIGTADPIELVAAAKDGRWLVACQARKNTDGVAGTRVTYGWNELRYGDALAPYLFRGAGTGMPIDALVASSDDDRWLAVLRDHQLVLIDDSSGAEVTLRDADLSPQRGVPRVAVFDRSSEHLIYFRARAGGNRVVVRGLATGDEHAWPVPAGLVWRVEPELGSTWARVELVERDTDGNGALEGMNLRAEGARSHRCQGELGDELPSSNADALRALWLDLATGALDEDPAVIAYLGPTRVVQGRDRAVRVGAQTIVPAACNAEVHAIVAAPLRVVASCDVAEPKLEIFGPRFHVEVAGSRGSRPDPEFNFDAPNRSRVLVIDAKALCPDFESCFRVVDGVALIQPPQRATSTGDVLLRSDDAGNAIIDAASGRVATLAIARDEWPRVWGLHHAAYGRKIVELSSARVIGEVMRLPSLIDAAGRALLPTTGCGRELCVGPLRWVTPRPVAPEPPPSGTRRPRAGTPMQFSGTAVDSAGAPIAGAAVTINQIQNKTVDGTTSTDEAANWRFPAANATREPPRSSQWRLPAYSDARGAFRVERTDDRATALMLVAPDGRVGVINDLRAPRAGIAVELRAPGEVHVTCGGAFWRIELTQGELSLDAACDDRITGVPPGTYRVLAFASPVIAAATLEVPSGGSVELEVTPPTRTVVRGRAVSYPDGAPLAGATCQAHQQGDNTVGDPGTTGPDGSFALIAQDGDLWVTCRDRSLHAEGTAAGSSRAPILVRNARHRRGGVDVGVEADPEPRGLRIRYAEGRAVRAGLRAGDLIIAVDGAALAGLPDDAMASLALSIPPDAPVRWIVERGGAVLSIDAPPW